MCPLPPRTDTGNVQFITGWREAVSTKYKPGHDHKTGRRGSTAADKFPAGDIFFFHFASLIFG
jgi:hypothetical protein